MHYSKHSTVQITFKRVTLWATGLEIELWQGSLEQSLKVSSGVKSQIYVYIVSTHYNANWHP